VCTHDTLTADWSLYLAARSVAGDTVKPLPHGFTRCRVSPLTRCGGGLLLAEQGEEEEGGRWGGELVVLPWHAVHTTGS